ncbi:MAG: SDR family NAD(P)-dependent oxidoreductase [Chloroflexota bacterium]
MEKKVVIITGASSGIGWAVARLAARKGYRVVLNARRDDRLQDLADTIKRAGGDVLTVQGDIALLETQEQLIEATINRYGRLDVLVNNAGLPLPAPFSECVPEDLRRQWDVNVTTLSTLTRMALPHLVKSGGTVINIGSSISRFPVPSMGNYAPTKIAVAALSNALLIELAPKGVKVCLVEPGPITTEFTERAGGKPGSSMSISTSADDAATAIVRLFEHPHRRLVIPGWLAPVLSIGGFLTKVSMPLIDAALLTIARLRSRRKA